MISDHILLSQSDGRLHVWFTASSLVKQIGQRAHTRGGGCKRAAIISLSLSVSLTNSGPPIMCAKSICPNVWWSASGHSRWLLSPIQAHCLKFHWAPAAGRSSLPEKERHTLWKKLTHVSRRGRESVFKKHDLILSDARTHTTRAQTQATSRPSSLCPGPNKTKLFSRWHICI